MKSVGTKEPILIVIEQAKGQRLAVKVSIWLSSLPESAGLRGTVQVYREYKDVEERKYWGLVSEKDHDYNLAITAAALRLDKIG